MTVKRVQGQFVTDGHALITGPISGTFVLEDGTEYDVTPEVIEVASLDHALELDAHVSLHHVLHDSHPLHSGDVPFHAALKPQFAHLAEAFKEAHPEKAHRVHVHDDEKHAGVTWGVDSPEGD